MKILPLVNSLFCMREIWNQFCFTGEQSCNYTPDEALTSSLIHTLAISFSWLDLHGRNWLQIPTLINQKHDIQTACCLDMIWIQISGRTCNAGCMLASATAICSLGAALLQGRSAQLCWNLQVFCCRTICAYGLAEIITMVWRIECMGRSSTIEGQKHDCQLFHLLHTSSVTVHGRARTSKKSCSSLCAYSPRKCKYTNEGLDSDNGKISRWILSFLFLWTYALFHMGVNCCFSTVKGRRHESTYNDYFKIQFLLYLWAWVQS